MMSLPQMTQLELVSEYGQQTMVTWLWLELMLDRRLPNRQSPTWYVDDPDLLMFSVDQLTTVQFDVLGCSGARFALLQSPWNFSDFIELAIGTEDNTLTAIRFLSATVVTAELTSGRALASCYTVN